jgi:hypothetical protein
VQATPRPGILINAQLSPPSDANEAPQEVAKTKPQLTNFPVEILTQILNPLLVHQHSIAIPTFDDDEHPELRPHDPSLSLSILCTCRHLFTMGKRLFYEGNVFNTGAHHAHGP